MANEEKAQVDQAQASQAPEESVDETPAGSAGEAGAAEGELLTVEQLQEALSQAREALADAEDRVLRAKADAQNARRRAQQDVEKAHKFALEKFTQELLPVVDSLERAIEAAANTESSHEAIREGVDMTLKMMLAVMGKFSIQQVDPQGEPFDPTYHQAMSMVESADAEPNSVLAVMQKGYVLNERLVRPAMVVVSKAAPKIDEQA